MKKWRKEKKNILKTTYFNNHSKSCVFLVFILVFEVFMLLIQLKRKKKYERIKGQTEGEK